MDRCLSGISLIARPISAEASPFESARNVALAEGMQSRGWIDAFGRRQGVWTVRDENGCKRIESAWSDGRPNGRFADWDASGWLRRETSHRDGVEHGEHTTWYENGEIESIENVVDQPRIRSYGSVATSVQAASSRASCRSTAPSAMLVPRRWRSPSTRSRMRAGERRIACSSSLANGRAVGDEWVPGAVGAAVDG